MKDLTKNYEKNRYGAISRLSRILMTSFLLLICGTALAQTSVSGTVTDETGDPMPGVTVVVKGTSTGTSTDINGRYSINVSGSASVLQYSFVGYTTEERTVGAQQTIDVGMTEETGTLDEVVVIGYGSMKKSDLTGSITAIGAKDFQRGVVATPSSLITGKVAGVQVISNGGRAGDGSTIRIRGGASLNASNDPLIVIDGVPLDNDRINGAANPLASINPNDIESMNILKDASATAIYGSRASNGVIIITTKKGSRTGGIFFDNFSTQNSIATVARRVEVMTGDDIRDLVNQTGDQSHIDMLGTANTDWQNQIYRPAFTTDNNLALSGGVKNMPFRLSVGFLSQDGTLKTDNVKRTTVSLNVAPSLFDNHLKININLKGAYSHHRFGNGDAIGAAIRMDPTKPVRSDEAAFSEVNGYWNWMQADGSLNTLATKNPVALLNGKDDESDVLRSIGNIQFDYKMHFLPDLRANVNMGYDISQGDARVITQPWSPTFFTKGASPDASGEQSKSKQGKRNLLFEAYLDYSKQFNEAHKIEVMAGYTYQDWLTTDHLYQVYWFDNTTPKGNPPTFATDEQQHTLISFYGRLNYNFKEKYLLTATLREDGSSRFSKENRWGLFPSAALAWRISEEDFMKGLAALSNMKLRLGYGVTGQQDGIGNYDYLAKYSLSENSARVQFGDQFYQMYRPDGYDGSHRWESTTTINVGLDFGFAKNRINGSIDLYQKETKDLLNNTALPMGSNFTNKIVQNIGKMNNKGVEFSLNVIPIDRDDFHWDFGFNLTFNKSEITKLTLNDADPNYPGALTGDQVSGGTGNYVLIHSVGYTPSMFYVYKQLYDADGKPIDYAYADLNDDGQITDADKYRYKSSQPDVYMGFTTNVTWKRWTLATALRASIGNYIFNNPSFDIVTLTQVNNPNAFVMNSLPVLKETMFSVKQKESDYFVENASFLKMDYVQLAYDFGQLWDAVGLTANVTVQNVFTLTKYKGVDPEIQSGVDNNFYPNSRTFSIGLKLNF